MWLASYSLLTKLELIGINQYAITSGCILRWYSLTLRKNFTVELHTFLHASLDAYNKTRNVEVKFVYANLKKSALCPMAIKRFKLQAAIFLNRLLRTISSNNKLLKGRVIRTKAV